MRARTAVLVTLATACVPTEGPPTPPAEGGCRFLGTDDPSAGAVTPPSPDGSCVVLATVNPLSGALGPVGLALENAARLAVRDVNAAGGVAGKRLCLVACDDKTDPTSAGALATDLVATYAPLAVNGGAASAVSLELAKVLGPREIAQVSCCSTSPALSADRGVYRTVPSDALQGVVLAGVSRALAPPAEEVAIIHIADTYGVSLAGVFEAAFGRLGGRVTRKVAYQPGAPSYLPVLEEALTPAPSHAVLIAFPTDGAQVLRDWRDSGLAPHLSWLATDGLRDDKFVQGASGLAEGTIGTAPKLVGAHYSAFEARYRAAFGGEAPGIFTSNQYDAILLVALGLARTGGQGGAALKEAIRAVARAPGPVVTPADVAAALTAARAGDVDYSGASGEVEMDDQGDVISDYSVWAVGSAAIADRPECWTCALGAEGAACTAQSGGCR